MKKAIKPEQRQWIVNKKLIVSTREAGRRCLVCKKKLSQYNLTKYCFNHQTERQKAEDDQFEYYSMVKRKENYGRVKNEKNIKIRVA